MRAAAKTRTILGALLIAIIAWDIYLALNDAPMDTISEQIRELSRQYLIIPFAAGVVCGHWFWGKQAGDEGRG